MARVSRFRECGQRPRWGNSWVAIVLWLYFLILTTYYCLRSVFVLYVYIYIFIYLGYTWVAILLWWEMSTGRQYILLVNRTTKFDNRSKFIATLNLTFQKIQMIHIYEYYINNNRWLISVNQVVNIG